MYIEREVYLNPVYNHSIESAENICAREYSQQQQHLYFKAAIDTAAHAAKESHPIVSIALYSIGLTNADNIFESATKILSIIDAAKKL